MKAEAIILAAGKGTRMKSKLPKVAHRLLGRPLVRWVVEAAHDAGVERPVCVLGHGIDIVRPLVEPDCAIAVQPGRLGTADAVASAQPQFDGAKGSLLVLSGDCPLITAETLTSLVAAREESDAGAAVLTMRMDDPTGYGRILRDGAGEVERIVEQKDCTPEQALINECNSGFYCFDAELLFDALAKVGSDNAQGEFYLTDVVEIARAAGRAVVGVESSDPTECLGINTRVQLAEALRIMRNRINLRHMLAGVTLWDPQSTYIGPDVRIVQDVEVLPQTFLLGDTSIGADATIGPNAYLVDCTVGAGCAVHDARRVGATLAEESVCDMHSHCETGAK